TVSTGKETLAGTVNVTNDEGTEYQTFTVGELKFAEPGSYTITLKPTSKPGKTVMQFDKLTLRGDFLGHATRQHYAVPEPERISLAVVPSDQGIPHNTLSEDEVAEGWELLFDGESNTGWSGYRKAEFPDGWSTNDGMLFFRGDKAAT